MLGTTEFVKKGWMKKHTHAAGEVWNSQQASGQLQMQCAY